MQQQAIVWISTALTLLAWPHVSSAQSRGRHTQKPRAATGTVTIAEPDMTRVFDSDVRKLLKLAFQEEGAGNQEKALELLQQAHATGKSAATQAELGLAHLRAKNYILAARHLTRAMTSYDVRLLARSEEYILDKLDAAKKEVGTLNVRVNVPKSVVNVDGEIIRDWPFHEQIFVVPGQHDVKAMKPGYWMSHIDLEISAGQTKEVTFTLQERIREEVYNMSNPLNVNLNATATAPEREPSWIKPLLIGSGIGLALSGGVLALGLMNKSTANDEWNSFNQDSWCQDPANAAECKAKKDVAADDRAKWNSVAVVGGIGTAVSVAGLIIGLVSRPSSPTQVTIQPVAGPDGVGGLIRGRL